MEKSECFDSMLIFFSLRVLYFIPCDDLLKKFIPVFGEFWFGFVLVWLHNYFVTCSAGIDKKMDHFMQSNLFELQFGEIYTVTLQI